MLFFRKEFGLRKRKLHIFICFLFLCNFCFLFMDRRRRPLIKPNWEEAENGKQWRRSGHWRTEEHPAGRLKYMLTNICLYVYTYVRINAIFEPTFVIGGRQIETIMKMKNERKRLRESPQFWEKERTKENAMKRYAGQAFLRTMENDETFWLGKRKPETIRFVLIKIFIIPFQHLSVGDQ